MNTGEMILECQVILERTKSAIKECGIIYPTAYLLAADHMGILPLMDVPPINWGIAIRASMTAMNADGVILVFDGDDNDFCEYLELYGMCENSFIGMRVRIIRGKNKIQFGDIEMTNHTDFISDIMGSLDYEKSN